MNPRFSKFLFCVFVAGAGVTPAYANPEGGAVSAGSATITSSGTQLTVHQSSHRAVIDWRSFDIAPNETTTFFQPSSSATVLNRVNSVDPSQILGTLKANGHVMIVNPNGVFFGAGSHVDVGSLTATTADIANEDFMAGRMNFNKPGKPDAKIVNEGHITASDAGLVNLVAPEVENDGVISATLGKITLASGDHFTLDLANDGLLQIAVSEQTLAKQSVTNAGHIAANGGSVHLTAAAARDAVDSLITNTGVIEAKSLGVHKGSVTLAAQGANKTEKSGASAVVNSGRIDVSGEQGGDISLLGDIVWMESGASLNASGVLGGGKIMIGGDYHGEGGTQTARTTYVGSDIFIKADALENGNGGNVAIWADDNTDFFGDISVRGGDISGDGGFVEVSGKEYLNYRGHTDALAAHGETGLLLLDPATLAIMNGSGDGAADGTTTFKGASTVGTVASANALSTIYESELEGIASSVNVSIAASSAITIANLADNNLNFAQVGGKSVTMTAAGGGIVMADTSDTITTAGGSFTATAAAGNITLGNITTNGGAVNITTTTSGITSVGNVSAGGGLITFNVAGASSVGVISGTGTGVTKVTGTGALTMNYASTYTGNTTLTNGTIIAGDDSAFGTGTFIFNGGTLQANSARAVANAVSLSASSTVSGTNDITFNGQMTGIASMTLTNNSSGLLTLGNINLAVSGTKTLTIGGTGNTTIGGVISNSGGTGSLTKSGTGTLILNGANTLSGTVTLSAGTLQIGHDSALGTGGLTLGAGVFQGDGTARTVSNTVSLSSSTTISGASDLSFTGKLTNTQSGNPTITLSNDGETRFGDIDLASGTTGRTVVFAGTGNATVNGTIANGSTNASNISKTGSGNLTLNGNNTYGGTTTITAGTMIAGSDTAFGTGTISLNGGTLQGDGTARTLGNAITLAASSTIGGSSALTFTGAMNMTTSMTLTNNNTGLLTLGAVTVTSTSARNLTLAGNGDTSISGIMANGSSGAAGLIKGGTGTLTFNALNTYTGGTTINGGTLKYGTDNALNAGAVTIADGATYDLNDHSDTIGALAVKSGVTGGLVKTGTGTLGVTSITSTGGADNASITGKLSLGGSARTITTTNAADGLTISAEISGTGGLTKAGAGSLNLTGNNSYSGTTSLPANVGTLIIGSNTALGTSTFSVSGSTIQGDGTARTLANAITLTTGMTVGGTSALSFTGAIAGGSSNRTITNNNAALLTLSDITLSSTSSARTLTITGTGDTTISGVIANGSSSTSNLTMSGSGTLTLSNTNSYSGSTNVNGGMLVVAASGAANGAVNIASGAMLKYEDDNALGTGLITVNDGGTLDLNNHSDTIGALSVNGGTTGGTVNTGTGTLTLGGSLSSSGGSNAVINGKLDLGSALRTTTITGSTDQLTLNAAVSGTGGFSKAGAGTLALAGTNNYTGSTNVTAGKLSLSGGAALDDDNLVTMSNTAGAALELLANERIGNLRTGGSNGGDVNLNSFALTLGDATDTTYSGIISGTGSIVKQGSGIWTLAGSNTYTGDTTISDGTLKLGAADRIDDASNIVVASGATFDLAGYDETAASIDATGAVVFGTTSKFTTSGAQLYTGAVTGSGTELVSTGSGAITANNDQNDFTGQLAISTAGNASVHDANALSLGAISAAKFAAFALDGDMTLNDNIVVTDTGASAIVLSAAGSSGLFMNTVGAGVFTTGTGGFWKVYSKTPVGSNRNGLAPDFKQYNAVYGDTLLGTGDGFIYSAAPIITASLTGTVQKTYNGSTAATLAGSNYSLSGEIDGDTVTLNNPTSGSYDDANAGSGKTVSVTGLVIDEADDSGAEVYGYQLASSNLSDAIGAIDQAALTVSTANVTRAYDGSLTAAGVATVTSGTLYSNASNGGAQDSLSGGTFAFTNANAGTNKTVSVSGIGVNDGNSGGNYNITQADNTTSTITKADISIGSGDVSRAYNGTTAAAGTAEITSGTLYSNASNSGTQDSISGGSFAFDNANAGTNKIVSTSGVTVADGNSGGNYYVTYVNNTHSTISQAALVISTSAVNKVYDGSLAAGGTAIVSSGTLHTNASNGNAPDSISGGSFAFTNANAGTGKTVAVSGVSVIDGNSGGNYAVTYANNTSSAITPAPLTVSTTDIAKVYDGTTAATGAAPAVTSGTLYNNISNGGAQDSLTGGSFAFDTAAVGTGKHVSVGGVSILDGNGGGNYNLTLADNVNSSITASPPPAASPPPPTPAPDAAITPPVPASSSVQQVVSAVTSSAAYSYAPTAPTRDTSIAHVSNVFYPVQSVSSVGSPNVLSASSALINAMSFDLPSWTGGTMNNSALAASVTPSPSASTSLKMPSRDAQESAALEPAASGAANASQDQGQNQAPVSDNCNGVSGCNN